MTDDGFEADPQRRQGLEQDQLAKSLLQYPCDYPMRVMGLNQPELLSAVLDTVRRHAPDFNPDTLETRPSRMGNYLAIRFSIMAQSRAQLDALYQELSKLPLVKTML